MHLARPLVGAAPLVLAGLVLSACAGSGGGSSTPTWEPSPVLGAGGGGPGPQLSPIVPAPAPSGSTTTGRGPTGRTPSRSSTRAVDPDVVATHLRAPIGLTMLPDGTALVGERTTGRVVQVQPVAGRPVPTVRVIRGLDTEGDGGLLDLALSPTYSEDGLIYAYVTTPSDNRVVDFTLRGPATPVFTGIPRGPTGNSGRIAFGADGDLYIGTGDAGDPALAANPRSLAGKVLRVNDIGDPAPGNPVASSAIFTSGHRGLAGVCGLPQSTTMLEVEGGRSDEINVLRGGGFYGPRGSAGRPALAPAFTLPAKYPTPGDCAVLAGRLWVTSLNGQALLSASLRGPASVPPGTSLFSAVLVKRYGRLKTVVGAADGALWLTTSNRDGHGKPVPADERVIRYVPSADVGHSPF